MLLDDDPESDYRAKIILLKDDGYAVPEIRRITNHHDNNIRKWIHRFNEQGTGGIISRKHTRNAVFTDDVERKIVDISLKKSTKILWIGIFYMVFTYNACFLMDEIKLVNSISHTEIRNILLKHRIKWRHSKTIVGNNKDPEYNLKKIH